MILSGSKSYYDNYARKRDINRTLHDPPSLLTDRGAYVNYLEVQLERISSACLGVHGYDQRFCDMQDLIVCLEQRCASTTKLVSLAQQCTEELKKNTENSMEKVVEDTKKENWEMKRMLETMSARIAAVEYNMTSIPKIQEQLNTVEDRILNHEKHYNKHCIETHEKIESIEIKQKCLEEKIELLEKSIEELHGCDSRLQFDMEEMSRKSRGMVTALEEKIMGEILVFEENFSRLLSTAASKTTSNIESLAVDITNRESGCLSKIRLLGESLRDDMSNITQKFNEDIRKIFQIMEERVKTESAVITNSVHQKIESLHHELEAERVSSHMKSEENRKQFSKYNQSIISLGNEQEDLFRLTCRINEALQSATIAAENTTKSYASAELSDDERSRALAAERIRLTNEVLRDELKAIANESDIHSHTLRANRDRITNNSNSTSKNMIVSESNNSNDKKSMKHIPTNQFSVKFASNDTPAEASIGELGFTANARSQPSSTETKSDVDIKKYINMKGDINGKQKRTSSPLREKLPSNYSDRHSNKSPSREYLDYIGGGLYSDGESAKDTNLHQRAVNIGLNYIGEGLYAPAETLENTNNANNSVRKYSVTDFDRNLSQSVENTSLPNIGNGGSLNDNKNMTDNSNSVHHDVVENAFRNFLNIYREDQKEISSR
jgi:hypothetical protein